jgi:hypothetical protein
MKCTFYIGKIFLYPWAKVTQVSDVAHGPLVRNQRVISTLKS